MEFQDALRRRKMCRSFADRPVDAALLDRILTNARRAPSAGFSQGWAFVVLEGQSQTRMFWDYTTDESWQADPDWPGLLRAPIIILPLADKQTYLDRYSEPDKAKFGLGDERKWPVPFWIVDTAFATMAMLLTAADSGLGALFFGIARGEQELLASLGVPSGYQPIGAV
ncbi:MAG TPA: nitroreductase family protein, partial [Acidimicrobiales bacterium]|nr:nitroreductase family protein [Acidimicrobiales bacterium]